MSYAVYAYNDATNGGTLVIETKTLLEARRNARWYAKRYAVETEVVRNNDQNTTNRYGI